MGKLSNFPLPCSLLTLNVHHENAPSPRSPSRRGEEYVSALIEEEGQLVRKDFTQSQWNGPDESCIGWWTSVVPLLDSDRVYWAPNSVLLSFFEIAARAAWL